MLTFGGSRTTTRVEPILPIDIDGEKFVLIAGVVHLIFGIFVILLQMLSAFISWAYYNHNMFEDYFKPGIWLGFPMVIMGTICIIQFKRRTKVLHIVITIQTLINVAVAVYFIALKVRWIKNNPETRAFIDCDTPRWPKSFIMDDAPHCNALKMNNSIGQSMLAFASGEIILCFLGLYLIQRQENRKRSLGLRYGPPNYISSSTMGRV